MGSRGMKRDVGYSRNVSFNNELISLEVPPLLFSPKGGDIGIG